MHGARRAIAARTSKRGNAKDSGGKTHVFSTCHAGALMRRTFGDRAIVAHCTPPASLFSLFPRRLQHVGTPEGGKRKEKEKGKHGDGDGAENSDAQLHTRTEGNEEGEFKANTRMFVSTRGLRRTVTYVSIKRSGADPTRRHVTLVTHAGERQEKLPYP